MFRKRKSKLAVPHEATPECANVTSTVHEDPMEKMKKWFNLWAHEMTMDLKERGIVVSIREAESQRNL